MFEKCVPTHAERHGLRCPASDKNLRLARMTVSQRVRQPSIETFRGPFGDAWNPEEQPSDIPSDRGFDRFDRWRIPGREYQPFCSRV
jgi:hypothetical protein